MRTGLIRNACSAAFVLAILAAAFWPGAGASGGGAGGGGGWGGDEIYVGAAASLSDALEELAKDFERLEGTKVRLDISSSGSLRRKVEAGCGLDVFISASTRDVDLLEQSGFVARGNRVELLTNAIVCVIPIASDMSMRSPDELLSSRVRLVAMGDPEHVPAGAYGKEALSSLGLWEALLPKMVPCANTRAALSHAAVSTVEAAILYSTDAQVSKKVKVAFVFPPTSHSRIVYPGVVLKRSANREAGRRFLAFLASPPAQAVFKRHGFKPVGETG